MKKSRDEFLIDFQKKNLESPEENHRDIPEGSSEEIPEEISV